MSFDIDNESSSVESDSEEDDDAHFRPRGRPRERCGRRGRGRAAEEAAREVDPPPMLRLGVPGRGRGGFESIAGTYERLDADFNGRPGYSKAPPRGHFLFWSKAFRDWKLAERLEDDGVCIAYATDFRGHHPPWASRGALQWHLWDPGSRRFVSRRLAFESLYEAELNMGDDDEKDDEVPWSRSPLSLWTTTDLIRWCDRHGVDLRGCFDREELLERVAAVASVHSSGDGASKPSRGSDTDEAPRRERRQRREGGNTPNTGLAVKLASRMKTDGSYTRRPFLDDRVSVYGNRVERFYGGETEVVPWLYEFGDKSRLYGVFVDGSFGYSLVWKKQKYWGRAEYR